MIFDRLSHMEPLFPKATKPLVDLAMEVFRREAELGGLVHPLTRKKIARLLRHINSYYSNRIEGEHTNPVDIERAVRKEYSKDEEKKRLQKLSVAHIEVQKLIDDRFEKGEKVPVCSSEFLCWIHREFYSRVPDSFLKIRKKDSDEIIEMVPGKLRTQDVEVGEHVAPVHSALEDFLTHFEKKYDPKTLSGHTLLLAAAASHHRLVWIHPFLDGNGRVCRLFTYAYLRRANIESYGLWTLSRGLARKDEEYRNYLASADSPRRGDLDGRGNLSEKALNSFCSFFFETALDQIHFMKKLLNLEDLRDRILAYGNLRAQGSIPGEPTLRPEAKYVLAEVMMRGKIERGEVQRLIGMAERTARDLTKQLLEEELVRSDSHRSPLYFNIPPKVVGYYFPELYPAGTI
ncbi:Fic family protein [Gracilimonas sp.]|uniref:Fic family protein n=1 Tax=Gracilimonas sp. TaxID=1974203 RepID=UPI002871CA2E|nr:Fic family protein [Gracilimonas sp.]